MKLLLLCVIFVSGWVQAGRISRYDDSVGQWEDHYDEYEWQRVRRQKEPFPVCQRKRQSPIDIDLYDVTNATLPPLRMVGFNKRFAATLTNNGHTAELTINSNTKPTLFGGPLHTKYEFSQLHFHWGDSENIGSKHMIRGKKYPIEMHVVTYNTDYGDISSAMNYDDGICALSCLFELQNDDNKNYDQLVSPLSEITEPNTSARIFDHPTLFKLLPGILSSYYSYSGSLTTPPYPEVVSWIEFVGTVKISRKQLQLFRHLIDGHGHPMANNFRDIQPLNDRGVLYNDGDCS